MFQEWINLPSGVDYVEQDEKVVVSLTSWPGRIGTTFLAIESLLRQTYKPNNIILWLADSEYNENTVPEILNILKRRGLSIRFCENLMPATKLIPALKDFPDAAIITFDDDIVYPQNIIENLIKHHIIYPNSIIANRGRAIKKNEDGTLKPYVLWPLSTGLNSENEIIFLTGCGGTLYPPNSLHKEVLNTSKYLELCPRADDVWFNAMALLNNTPIRMMPHLELMFMDEPDIKQTALFNTNMTENDTIIDRVFREYSIFERIYRLYQYINILDEDKNIELKKIDEIIALQTFCLKSQTFNESNISYYIELIQKNDLYDFYLCNMSSGSGGIAIKSFFTSKKVQEILENIKKYFIYFCSPNNFSFFIFNGSFHNYISKTELNKLNVIKKFNNIPLLIISDYSLFFHNPKFNLAIHGKMDRFLKKDVYIKKMLMSIATSFVRGKTFLAPLRFLNNPKIFEITKNLYDQPLEEQNRIMNFYIQKSIITADFINEKPFIIPPHTIRIWLTDSDFPLEVSDEKLENYNASISLENTEKSKHTFWCLDPTKIPKTIEKLRVFT